MTKIKERNNYVNNSLNSLLTKLRGQVKITKDIPGLKLSISRAVLNRTVATTLMPPLSTSDVDSLS